MMTARRLSCLALVVALSGAAGAQAPEPARARAEALLAQMTLDEKLQLVHGTGFSFGSGYAGRVPPIERLGIPALVLADGPNGVGNGSKGVTAFPAAIAVAATWDEPLLERYGSALGREQAGKGHNVALTPTINILRVPQWGRTFESFSEDPWLTARLAVAQVKGIQGAGVIATAKHFAANNQETLRNTIDVKVGERALREIYLPAFRAAVGEGGAMSVMCSYNRLNGTFACEHPWLLKDVLKREWGFSGFVMSDWFATHSTVAAANGGLDMEMPAGNSPLGQEYFGAALRKAVEARQVSVQTLDEQVRRILVAMIETGLLDRRATGTPDAVVSSPEHHRLSRDLAASGTVLLRNERGTLPLATPGVRSVAVIGDAAQEHPKYAGGGSAQVDLSRSVTPLQGITTRAGAAVKVTYARGTLGTAPLPGIPASVLTPAAGASQGVTAAYFASADFTGTPVATRTETALGGERPARPGPPGPPVPGLPRVWSARWTGTLAPPAAGRYRFSLAGGGTIRLLVEGKPVVSLDSQFPTTAHGAVDLQAGRPVPIVLEYAATGLFGGPAQVGWQPPDPGMLEQAVAAARSSDAAIVFVDDVTTEGSDRPSLALPGDQDRLIAAVAAANPRTIVVMNTGGAVLMPWLTDVAAVIAAWYPGQESGDAIAAVLFGDVNPSGRLPITFPATDGQGLWTKRDAFPGNGTTVTYDEELLVGYRWYDARDEAPLFAFGHGLSYTTFTYDALEVTAGTGAARLGVRARVANAGSRAGSEVVQLYVGFPPAAGEPPRQLKGFRKVALEPGASAVVEFELDREALSIWGDTGWTSPAGAYHVALGASSRDLRLTRRIQLAD